MRYRSQVGVAALIIAMLMLASFTVKNTADVVPWALLLGVGSSLYVTTFIPKRIRTTRS